MIYWETELDVLNGSCCELIVVATSYDVGLTATVLLLFIIEMTSLRSIFAARFLCFLISRKQLMFTA